MPEPLILKNKKGVLFMRNDGRKFDELRNIKITRNYTKFAEGSVLIEAGNTVVLCNASISNEVPNFLKDSEKGWITAEYSMLPRSVPIRIPRDISKGKVNGRSQEIQRLIGRALRSVVNLEILKGKSIIIDADVIQADGGTRTAAITGSFIALKDAVKKLLDAKEISIDPISEFVAAVSVGIVEGQELLDLNFAEDSKADVDMNVVMTESGKLVEIQATSEKVSFSDEQLQKLISLSKSGIERIIQIQKQVLK